MLDLDHHAEAQLKFGGADPALRTQFAKVLAILGNYPEAIEQLHIAIGSSPDDNSEAFQELERIEGLLNSGEDQEYEMEDGTTD